MRSDEPKDHEVCARNDAGNPTLSGYLSWFGLSCAFSPLSVLQAGRLAGMPRGVWGASAIDCFTAYEAVN